MLALGPNQSGLHRRPVVTFALMGLLFMVWVLMTYRSDKNLEFVYRAAQLQAGTPVPSSNQDFLRIYRDIYDSPPPPMPDTPEAIELQRRLDRIANETIRDLDEKAEAIFGIVPTRVNPVGMMTWWTINRHFMALAINLLLIFFTLPYIENRWGPQFTVVVILCGGFLLGVLEMLIHFNSWRWILGSEPVVAMLMGIFAVRFHSKRHSLKGSLTMIVQDAFFNKPMILFPIVLAVRSFFELLPLLFLERAPGDATLTFEAPYLGFALGAGLAAAIQKLELEPFIYKTPFERRPIEEQYQIRIKEALDNKRTDEVLTLMRELTRAVPGEMRYRLQLWDQLVRSDRIREGVNIGREVADHLTQEQDYENAYFVWKELTQALPDENLSLSSINELAHGLLATDSKTQAENLLIFTFQKSGGDGNPEALMKLAETASFVSPDAARTATEMLLPRQDLDAQQRAQLEEWRKDANLLASGSVDQEQITHLNLSEDPTNIYLEDPFSPTLVQQLVVTNAVPLQIDQNGLALRLDDGRNVSLAWSRIKAVTAGAIRPIGGGAYMCIDLLADPPSVDKPQHHCLRLDVRRFDPRALMRSDNPAEAVRALLRRIMEQSGAQALPDSERLLGARFLSYASIGDLEVEIYGVNS